jgi:hypothetical protein
MNDPITVRIGMSSARELELSVEEPQVVADSYENALKGKDTVLWVTDTRGHRFGLAVASIAFIEVEQPQDRGIGFAPPA